MNASTFFLSCTTLLIEPSKTHVLCSLLSLAYNNEKQLNRMMKLEEDLRDVE